jgi:mRNA interferase RelE/StbE
VICRFKKTFLKDLSELPANYRKKIERLVFEQLPEADVIPDGLDVRKMEGHQGYYRIRIGSYRIGCEIESGPIITFYRAKSRKDIYRLFP